MLSGEELKENITEKLAVVHVQYTFSPDVRSVTHFCSLDLNKMYIPCLDP